MSFGKRNQGGAYGEYGNGGFSGGLGRYTDFADSAVKTEAVPDVKMETTEQIVKIELDGDDDQSTKLCDTFSMESEDEGCSCGEDILVLEAELLGEDESGNHTDVEAAPSVSAPAAPPIVASISSRRAPFRASTSRASFRAGGGSSSDLSIMAQELIHMKQENHQIKAAVMDLQADRDNLRMAIRKLKVENSRMKQKMKRFADAVTGSGIKMQTDDDEMEMDYDEVKEFLLIGGPVDPFSLRYEVAIKDANNVEHKSAERYFWYKMAEQFGDKDAAEKIRTAATVQAAEEVVKNIKDFDEAAWKAVKVRFWEEAQKLKLDQVRWIQNLLVFSEAVFLAVASQDKVFGTGWRKNRQESSNSRMWDGENQGGKALMKLREQYKLGHSWMGPNEQQETEKKYRELKNTAWRRQMDRQGGFRGGRGGRGGGRGGGGFPSKRR